VLGLDNLLAQNRDSPDGLDTLAIQQEWEGDDRATAPPCSST
jgi:hypothetical protein